MWVRKQVDELRCHVCDVIGTAQRKLLRGFFVCTCPTHFRFRNYFGRLPANYIFLGLGVHKVHNTLIARANESEAALTYVLSSNHFQFSLGTLFELTCLLLIGMLWPWERNVSDIDSPRGDYVKLTFSTCVCSPSQRGARRSCRLHPLGPARLRSKSQWIHSSRRGQRTLALVSIKVAHAPGLSY